MSENGVAHELRFIRHTVYKIAKAINIDVCDCDDCFLLKIHTEQENSSPVVPKLVNLNNLRTSCRRRALKVESTTDPESQNEPVSSISMEFKRRKMKTTARKNDRNSQRRSSGRPKRSRSTLCEKNAGPTIMKVANIPLQRCDYLLENGPSTQDAKLIDLISSPRSRKRPADLNLSFDYSEKDRIDEMSDSRRRSCRRLSMSPSRFPSSSPSTKVPIRRTNRLVQKTQQIFPANLVIDL